MLKQKLLSRKFWVAVLVALGCLAAALFGDAIPADTMEALRCATAAGIAYICGESATDAVRLLREHEK